MGVTIQRVRRIAPAVALFLAACTDVPELDDRVPSALDRAGYPALVPLDRLLGAPVAPGEDAERIAGGLNARRADLRRRANAVQDDVIDPSTRTRMEEGVRP